MSDNKPVIVATDGSDHSLRILPHAARLAANVGAGIELLRVIEKSESPQEPGESAGAALERTSSRIQGGLDANLTHFGVEGATSVIVTPETPPAQAILQAASRGRLLAMNSRGRGGISRMLHGSVAIDVLKGAGLPIMLGGPNLLAPRAEDGAYRLLATTDFSHDAEHCLRTIAPLLEQGKFHVTLLYVHLHAPGGLDNAAKRAQHEADLAEKRMLLPASVEVDTLVREIAIGGGIDTAIMEVAEQVGANAIAIATHGHSARRQVIMGSMAMAILSRSHLPLIMTRAQA